MTAQTLSPLTADAFDEWCPLPENAERRCELIHGEIVWVIDPELHVVDLYSLDEFSKVLEETDTLQGNGVMPELILPVRYSFNQESD